jgi:PAS domain S-box-containing protein
MRGARAAVRERAAHTDGDFERVLAENEFLREVYAAMPGAVIVVDASGRIESTNEAALDLLGGARDEIVGLPVREILDGLDLEDAIYPRFLRTLEPEVRIERTIRTRSHEKVPVLFSASPMVSRETGRIHRVLCVALDLRERKRLEIELRHAQKLEAVGRLAAGMAHEINTPVQFVSDGLHFLQGAFQDLLALVARTHNIVERSSAVPPECVKLIGEAEAQADLSYLREQVPRALDRTLDGVARVAGIVRAMRDFSHPDRGEKRAADLNRALENTLAVAKCEYRDVADVVMDFGPLPPVPCYLGELNQVFLNLIVNAAHAIADEPREGRRGVIAVRSRDLGGAVEVTVSDTGCGIPEEIRERVFEPFFTTKAPGRGTGQGLAIAHAIVADKHGGSLAFESEVGVGTTFVVRLPCAADAERTPDVRRNPATNSRGVEGARDE